MYNRARQPQVPNEDQESMFDAPGKIAQYDLQFPEGSLPSDAYIFRRPTAWSDILRLYEWGRAYYSSVKTAQFRTQGECTIRSFR